jgi:monoamine oxidase
LEAASSDFTFGDMGNEFDVVILEGAAGIGAARWLAAQEVSALLLEASSRLGGRAHTLVLGGYPLDLGCEWLHLGDRNASVGVTEASGFSVNCSDPP